MEKFCYLFQKDILSWSFIYTWRQSCFSLVDNRVVHKTLHYPFQCKSWPSRATIKSGPEQWYPSMLIKHSVKIVNYYDTLIIVPHWTKFLTMNKDGKIFAWETKPQTNSRLWYIFKQFKFQLVAYGDPSVIDWKKSLRRYYTSGQKVDSSGPDIKI